MLTSCLNGICILPGHPFVDCRSGSHSYDFKNCPPGRLSMSMSMSVSIYQLSCNDHPGSRPAAPPSSLASDTALRLHISTSPVTQLPRSKGPCGEGVRSSLIALYLVTCSWSASHLLSRLLRQLGLPADHPITPDFAEGCRNTPHDQLRYPQHRAYDLDPAT